MSVPGRIISWGIDYHGSTRPVGLIRIGLALLIWARFGYSMLPLHDLDVGNFTFRIVFFVSTFAMVIGFFSRFACLLSALCVAVLYYHYGQVAHHIYLLFVATLFLTLTPAGSSYSLDRWIALQNAEKARRAIPPETGNLLGLRLIALQLAAIYFWGAFGKMNPAFLNGERFQHLLHDFYGGVPFESLPGFEWFCAAAGSGVALFELCLSIGLLTPGVRKLFVPVGIVFHLTIYVFFPVLTFSLTMILLYLAFIPADKVHDFLDRMQENP